MKKSEKTLLAVFLGLLFLGVNWMLFQRFTEYTSTYDDDITRLTARRVQLNKLAEVQPEWLERRNWVTSNLPLYPSVDERDTYLINFIRKAASDSGVEIDRGPEAVPAKIEGHYESTGVTVTIVGEIEPVTRFLYSLQEPSSFRALTSVRLQPAKKGESALRTEISVEQWWAPNSLAAAQAATVVPQPPAPAANPPSLFPSNG